ncbi:MauE/DoxX family redox-associated membrane protein [Streptomyces sp. NPDC005271]|uniref:MauE/DoxX family redox-associated membrane protein n=1 Tax=unclassified Streptomyces TaxID=2593676 RepID=UPI0033AE6915
MSPPVVAATDLVPLATAFAPLLLAGLLGPAGAAKLFGRGTARQAAGTALARLLRGGGRAAAALRVLGAVELLLAAALMALPATWAPGAAAAVLGAGFLGYLGYARAAAPGSSCGCTAHDAAPVAWGAFVRAGAVLTGGLAAALAQQPWWSVATRRPGAALCCILVTAAALAALSAGSGRRWLVPLRRLRLRLAGHPLAGTRAPAAVPVAATVELLENSRAWRHASPVVRSGLLDHWDDGGWRILQFAGVHGGGEAARPVLVLFAVDAAASLEAVREPAVRVSVIDAESGAAV